MKAVGTGAADEGATERRASLRRLSGGYRQIARDLTAGVIVGCIALPFCVIAGILAFEPLGPAHAGTGAAAGILCAVVGGIVGSLARTSSFIPNLPSSPMALIQASLVGTMMTSVGADVGLTLMLMPLSALLGGVLQILIAFSGLGRVVKFTPYPVLAGFLTGLAILILVQQLPRLFGLGSLGELVRAIPSPSLAAPALPLFGIGLVALMHGAERYAPRIPSLLVALVVGTALFHALGAVAPGLDLGRTIGPVSLEGVSLGVAFDPGTMWPLLVRPDILQALVLTAVTLAILGTLDLAFSLRAAQNLHDLAVDPKRNLAGQGLSNVAAAFSGGLMVTSSLSLGISIFQAGGRTRVSTLAVAVLLLAAAAFAPRLISSLPNIVLTAILVSIAIKLWDRWCITLVREAFKGGDPEARVRARRNAAIVAAVAAATVLGQPVVGALVGVVLSCLVFIIEMSRPVIRRELDGAKIFSKRIRSQAHVALLRRIGGRTAIFELQGVLFFGNADDLASAVRAAEKTSVDAIILDLRRVTDLDTSGATVLGQIADRCRKRGIGLLVAGIEPKFERLALEAVGADGWTLVFHDLDGALEAAEDRILGSETGGSAAWMGLNVEQTDFAGGLSESELEILKAHLEPASYHAGAALCRAGEPADRLWLLTRGSVSVRLPGARADRRIAGLGPGTSVGELGLLDRRPRSADVVADEDVDAWVLTADAFDTLLRDEPHLGQSLLATIARMTAQRLRTTSEELRLAEV